MSLAPLEEAWQGELVVLAPYSSGRPGVDEALALDLAAITGWRPGRAPRESTRTVPYDMQTNSPTWRRTSRPPGRSGRDQVPPRTRQRRFPVAVGRPDLVAAVVGLGTAPFARMHFKGSEEMISGYRLSVPPSSAERDARAALRTMLAATNTQMSEEEGAACRVFQISSCPQEPAAAPVRAWAEDDPTAARGDRRTASGTSPPRTSPGRGCRRRAAPPLTEALIPKAQTVDSVGVGPSPARAQRRGHPAVGAPLAWNRAVRSSAGCTQRGWRRRALAVPGACCFPGTGRVLERSRQDSTPRARPTRPAARRRRRRLPDRPPCGTRAAATLRRQSPGLAGGGGLSWSAT